MFTSVDKMLVAALGSFLTLAVGNGYITAEQAVSVSNIIVYAIGVGVTAFMTWLIPNKA